MTIDQLSAVQHSPAHFTQLSRFIVYSRKHNDDDKRAIRSVKLKPCEYLIRQGHDETLLKAWRKVFEYGTYNLTKRVDSEITT